MSSHPDSGAAGGHGRPRGRTTGANVTVTIGQYKATLVLESVLQHPQSLIGTAVKPEWTTGALGRAQGSAFAHHLAALDGTGQDTPHAVTTAGTAPRDASNLHVDLTGIVPEYSPELLDTISTFYATGDLVVPPGVCRYTALCCWNDLHLVPRLPSLLSNEDQSDLASLINDLSAEFLTYYESELRLLCMGEISDLVIILPNWNVAHQRAVVEVLQRAKDDGGMLSAAAVAMDTEDEDWPAVPRSPASGGGQQSTVGSTGPATAGGAAMGFESPEAAKTTINRLCSAASLKYGPALFAAAKDNVILSDPHDVDEATTAASLWLRRARQVSALARLKWVEHLFLRALAAQGLEADITKVTAKLDHGVYDYGSFTSPGGSPPRIAWFPWQPPNTGSTGAGWRVPSGDAVRIAISPHQGC